MTTTTIERNLALISLLGEDKVEAAYKLTAGEYVSMATLMKIITKKNRKKILETEIPTKELAKELGVHLSTLYRE